MALAQKSAAWKANYVPPPVDGDFYMIADISGGLGQFPECALV